MKQEIFVRKFKELDLRLPDAQVLIPEANQTELAQWVSEQTKTSQTMLPKSIEEVLAMFSDGRSIVLFDSDGLPAAHAAITFIYQGTDVVEVGGVVVGEDKRRRGFGTLASLATLELANEKFVGFRKLILCNSASLPIFLKLGGRIIGFDQADMVPREAWEACLTCPKYNETKDSGKLCCDTPVIFD